MLSTDKDLRYVQVAALPESLLKLLVKETVNVDVSGDDPDSQFVEQVENIATIFEGGADTAKTGDIYDHFPPLRV